MARTLLDKVWEAHTVRTLPSGQTQLLIGLHLIHEVTTPQAFQMLKELKLKVRMPERTFGTLDHIIPTADQTRPYADPQAEEMAAHMYRNMKEFGLPGLVPSEVERLRDERVRLLVVLLDALDQRVEQLHGRQLPRRDQARELGNREVVEFSGHGVVLS